MEGVIHVFKKDQWSLISLLIVFLFLVACSSNDTTTENEGGTTDGDESSGKQTLLVAADQDPSGMDPHTTTAHSSHRIMAKIYEGLLEFDENMQFAPLLAKEWEQVDETTYQFILREGVTFHNGREMTAEDVKYSFERILEPETGAISASYFKVVEEINVLSDYEIEFKLSQPYAPFLSYIASGANAAIIPKEAVEEHGNLDQVAVGTGPFVLKEMVPDTHVHLTKNEDYYIEGKPIVDELKYVTMVDESSRLAAIRTGEVHITTVSPDSVSLVEGNDELNVISYDGLEYFYLGFNVTNDFLKDKKVRQAISLAVDRQEIIDTIMAGEAKLSGPVPESLGDWSIDVSKLDLYQPNLDKANKLLEEASFEAGFELEMGVPSTEAELVSTAQIIEQQLGKIGINVTIVQLEWGEYIDAWNENTYDMLVGKNGSGRDPDRSLGFFFATDGSANVWGYSNKAYDELIAEGLEEVDMDKRHSIYEDAQKMIIEEAPNLFLLMPKSYIIVRENVNGYHPLPHDSEDFLELTLE